MKIVIDSINATLFPTANGASGTSGKRVQALSMGAGPIRSVSTDVPPSVPAPSRLQAEEIVARAVELASAELAGSDLQGYIDKLSVPWKFDLIRSKEEEAKRLASKIVASVRELVKSS